MIRLLGDGDEAVDAVECDLCGAQAHVDESLPFVNQTASFATDHGCPHAAAGRLSIGTSPTQSGD